MPFGFEQRRWGEEPLISNTNYQDRNGREIYQSNFVGIIWYQNTLILSMPKAADRSQEGQNVTDTQILLKYADLLEKYFSEVRETIARTTAENERKGRKVKSFEPVYPWCIDHLADWCRKMVDAEAVLPVLQVIAAVKFEKVFEWMLGRLFENQIVLEDNEVLLKSQILSEKDPDANISGWNEKKKCYKLPGNMDIYKQFFYQKQMLRIYEQAGQKDVCVSDNRDLIEKKNRLMAQMLTKFKRVVPMQSRMQESSKEQ